VGARKCKDGKKHDPATDVIASVMHVDNKQFDLTGRVTVITGGAGLLGLSHARAIRGAGGVPVLLDIAAPEKATLHRKAGFDVEYIDCDITIEQQLKAALAAILDRHGRIDVLINNAANNPKVETPGALDASRLENYPLEQWAADLAVGLTGAMLCSRVFGAEMARRGKGVIINIASDLALIAPDQRLYAVEGVAPDRQPVKPVSYSVVKTGLVGLTRYLATYWADAGVRANAICPGGVENNQNAVFLRRIKERIPLGRMAGADEYQGAILFLASDASSYMTGAVLTVDGGRSVW
jgi:NAD(P)-dependent dehydrogenase (short-subunit alcohol dehydrogenase family)